ncbi:MAG: hypothetical protein FJZ92_12215 [Chloroflexi bacterium]|nr:hypothetical protein [Chloroflexota bacterium]
MAEFAVLVVLALLVAAYVALPRRGDGAAGSEGAGEDAVDALRARRTELLAALRELDEDLAAGRIAADDRAAGRRALAPELRSVTEALRAHGAPPARAP